MERKILVAEINYLLSEYKELSIELIKEKLEEEYGHKVFLIDGSRANLQGGNSFNSPPIYLIG